MRSWSSVSPAPPNSVGRRARRGRPRRARPGRRGRRRRCPRAPGWACSVRNARAALGEGVRLVAGESGGGVLGIVAPCSRRSAGAVRRRNVCCHTIMTGTTAGAQRHRGSPSHELDAPPWLRVETTLIGAAQAIRNAYDVRLAPLGADAQPRQPAGLCRRLRAGQPDAGRRASRPRACVDRCPGRPARAAGPRRPARPTPTTVGSGWSPSPRRAASASIA